MVYSLLARQSTGKSCFWQQLPATCQLTAMGGNMLFQVLDGPAGILPTNVAFLAAAIDSGNWVETSIVS
jgi:hypothetical protein